jgi:four helix bundle protein
MNDPEMTMFQDVSNSILVAHAKVPEAAYIAIKLALGVPAPLKSIADCVIRSVNSVPASIAGGYGRPDRDRSHFWRIAFASAKEVDSHLRLLAQARAVNANGMETAVPLFDGVRTMT